MYMYLHTYVHTDVCNIILYVHVITYLHTYVHTNVRTYIILHSTCMYIVHIYLHICTCTNMYMYMYMYIHTYNSVRCRCLLQCNWIGIQLHDYSCVTMEIVLHDYSCVTMEIVWFRKPCAESVRWLRSCEHEARIKDRKREWVREGGREGGIGRLQKRNRQKVEIMRWQIRKMENGGLEILF